MIIRNVPITVGSVVGLVYNFNSIKSNSVLILNNGNLLLFATAIDGQTQTSLTHIISLHSDGSLNLNTLNGINGGLSYDFGAFVPKSAFSQSNGQILIVGDVNTSTDTNLDTGIDFGFVRLNADGTVDMAFSYPVGDGFLFPDIVSSVTEQSDGKILIAGTSSDALDTNFSIIRINVDGSLDTSFSADGTLVQPVGVGSLIDESSCVLIQEDGKILITGTSFTSQTDADFSVIRLNANGTLDNTYSGDGKVFIDVGGLGRHDTAVAGLFQVDGKLLIAGYSSTGVDDDFSLVRLNTDGSLDTSFSGDGKVLVDVGDVSNSDFSQSMALQSDGKILVAGYSFYPPIDYLHSESVNFSVIRLNADGSLDNSFNGTGKLIIHFDNVIETTPFSINTIQVSGFARSIVVQDDGQILLGGDAYGFGLVCINPNGTIDTTFGSNILFGDDSNNVLYGSSATETMLGGLGDDIYQATGTADIVVEYLNEGTDTVFTDVTYTLGVNVEQIQLTGALAINATGNTQNNFIGGNVAANVLNGLIGADTMAGGDGNDIYYVDNLGDILIETNADVFTGGIDTVFTDFTYTLGINLEQLQLTGALAINANGNTQNNFIGGNSSANVLNGLAGADTMAGGDGNDIYYVDNIGDIISETNAVTATGGNDIVRSEISYTLGTNLEQLRLLGSAAINGTGNTLNNTLSGNAAANVLNGLTGADTMIGGDGNDIYYVDNIGDVISETNAVTATGGSDIVRSEISYILGNNLEQLKLLGFAAINGTGNTLNNTLSGNAAANVLNGLTGADTMIGGDGNDIYYVDNLGDVISETNAVTATGGSDIVRSEISYTLGANLEQLKLIGFSAINATGNSLNNTLTGNAAANTLTGAAGTDTMTGGLDADTFDFNAILDSLTGAFRDVITDFSSAQLDKIDLSGIDAISSTGADDAFSYIGTGTFTNTVGELRFDLGVVYGDVNGDGVSDFEIQLTGVASMVAGDFVL